MAEIITSYVLAGALLIYVGWALWHEHKNKNNWRF